MYVLETYSTSGNQGLESAFGELHPGGGIVTWSSVAIEVESEAKWKILKGRIRA